MLAVVNRYHGDVVLCQEVADPERGSWQDSPTRWSSSYASIQLHLLIRGTTPYQAISHPFASPLVILSLFFSLSLPLSLGIAFLSAFYSKSDRKALDTQPNLRDSGYIWSAWYREMFHQWERWRASQKGGRGGSTGEERDIVIWYGLTKTWWKQILIQLTEVKKKRREK